MVADSDEPLEAPSRCCFGKQGRPRKKRIVVILEARSVRLQQQPAEVQHLKNKFYLHLHEISDLKPLAPLVVQAGNATSVGTDAMHSAIYSLSTRDVPTVRRQLRAREEMTWEVSRETTTFRAIPDFTGTGHTQ
jgi:hypothetical protein